MNNPRKDFRELYEYLSTSLDFQGIACIRNVSLAERPLLEAEHRETYSDYPYYPGIVELKNTSGMLQYAAPRPFYFPMHYIAPIEDYIVFLDLDLYKDTYHSDAIDEALTSGEAALTVATYSVRISAGSWRSLSFIMR